MRAHDLAAMLLQCSPDAEVYFTVADGCCGDEMELGEPEADFLGDSPHSYSLKDQREKNFSIGIRLQFPHLPGFRSCRQSGATKRSDEAYWKEFGKTFPESARKT